MTDIFWSERKRSLRYDLNNQTLSTFTHYYYSKFHENTQNHVN